MKQVIRWIQKPYAWAISFSLILIFSTSYVLLDAFVIPRGYIVVADKEQEAEIETETESEIEGTDDAIVSTEDSYPDGKVTIQITTHRVEDTTIYVADIVLKDSDSLKTAFARNTYGKNITSKTSEIARENEAILAINGDYYGVRDGYVIRNGVLYRDEKASEDQEDLVIGSDGSFSIIKEGEISAQELLDQGAVQVLSFGPALVIDGKICVTENDEVDHAMTSNPRTAIGIIDDLHYVMVVADGRTSESEGLTLSELASFMSDTLDTKLAYNLDGGGSSTMYFQGNIVNKPTTNGRKLSERSVSDIVYIG